MNEWATRTLPAPAIPSFEPSCLKNGRDFGKFNPATCPNGNLPQSWHDFAGTWLKRYLRTRCLFRCLSAMDFETCVPRNGFVPFYQRELI
jgi:hypothetical protein